MSESGRHLREIVASVKKVSDVVGEISNASQEQATSVEEISRAVCRWMKVHIRMPRWLSRPAAAASMQEQANKLAELTSFFKTQRDVGAVAAVVPTQAPTPARTPPSPKRVTRPAPPAAGKERRSTNRPWRKTEGEAPAAVPVAAAAGPKPVVAGASGSDDWSEF